MGALRLSFYYCVVFIAIIIIIISILGSVVAVVVEYEWIGINF